MTLVELINSVAYKKMSKDEAVFEAWMRACDNFLSKPATLSEEQWKAINKAWYAIGADIAGLDWLRFSALIAAEVKGKGE